MALKRMLKKRFDLYLNLILLPIIIAGLFFSIFPENFITFFFEEAQESVNSVALVLRLFFISQIMIGITILSTKDNPSRSRSLIFWLAIYLLAMSAFFIAGIFIFQLKTLAVLPGIFFILSGTFLLAYASRNILVRE